MLYSSRAAFIDLEHLLVGIDTIDSIFRTDFRMLR